MPFDQLMVPSRVEALTALSLSKGFDLGDSPREFTRQAVAGRDVILTTSNGTKTLRAIAGGRTVALARAASS